MAALHKKYLVTSATMKCCNEVRSLFAGGRAGGNGQCNGQVQRRQQRSIAAQTLVDLTWGVDSQKYSVRHLCTATVASYIQQHAMARLLGCRSILLLARHQRGTSFQSRSSNVQIRLGTCQV